jgi:hypothetical protein
MRLILILPPGAVGDEGDGAEPGAVQPLSVHAAYGPEHGLLWIEQEGGFCGHYPRPRLFHHFSHNTGGSGGVKVTKTCFIF